MRRRVEALLVGLAVFAAVLVLTPVSNANAVDGAASSVFINEIHYDNAGADTGEFIEVAGPAGTDLTGWTVVLYNGSNGTSYNTSALAGTLADAGDGYGFQTVSPSSIQNGAPDGMALVDVGGNVVQFLSYEGAITAADGPAVGQMSTDIGVSEPGTTPVGESLQLTGMGTTAGDFAWAAPAAESPGLANAGQTFGAIVGPTPTPTPPPVAAEVLIHEIQGSGSASPIEGQLVKVQAIVTALLTDDDALSGFFLQEEDAQADGSLETSEGVFVFCGGICPAGLAAGTLVDVEGVVAEFFGMTQINASSGSVATVTTGNALPTAASVALGAGSTADAATFETTEGMIVTFAETLAMSEYFQLARFGSVVLTQSERPSQFTDVNAPSITGYADHLADLASRRIILDDDNNDQNDRTTLPLDNEPYAWPDGGLSTTNFFRGGDTINGLTGVTHWSFDEWRIRPIDGVANPFVPAAARPTTPPDVGGSLTVASFNVLNYFATLDVPGAVCGPLNDGCRGAHSAAELDRQRAKIVAAMVQLDADVLGLMEIENDSDDASVSDLVAALNAGTSAGKYAFIATGTVGTDPIKQAFIYQPATVSPVGAFAILDSSVDATFNDDKNRPAIIQTFQEVATGAQVTIAVNHLKSKGSNCDDLGDPDLNDGAANCNLTRTSAATALANYLATDPTGSGDSDALIIGDLNAYAKEDPITALTSAGYVDLLTSFGGDAAYTYLFDGQIGSLDYALSNAALTPQVTGTAAWHINADEVPLFDYNDDIQDANEASFERESSALSIFRADAFRSSDHDPVVVGLDLDGPSAPPVTISVLHNNDGESKLLPDGDFPGIARFVTALKGLQAGSSADGVITLTSGDNFLASKEFNASLDNGVPYYDSIALSGLYDAMALGNHDFDFGPEVTAAFISGFDPAIPFLSANADFSGEPLLAALEASGQIAGSTVIDVAGTQVGVIGAVTPLLASISSPRNVVISADVAAAVNGEVAALEAAGVNKIILISHLQGVDEDRALIPLLSGVDVAIAGGGDELFANPGDTCNIGTVADTYPGAVVDADGNTVPLVTGPGGYRCIGQLDVTFTADGDLVTATGSANLVPLDATPDPGVLADVETPIAAAVAALEANVLGVSEVDLDGVRASVRTTSSNEGSLLADALLDAAQRLAPDFGATPPVIALQNGGGIRNDSVIPAGNITEGDTFDIAPFANFVVAVEVPRETLKDLLEVAYGGLPAASGRFAQPAGFTVRINPDAPAREIDSTCAVTGNTGERVLNMTLNDGTVIIQNGTVIPGPDISVATIDFLARGGDCYPLGNLTFTALGTSYQQALADYITGTLNNTITATQYPETGTNRVITVEPNVTVSVLHNNDGESKLLPDGDFPGIARFVTALKGLQAGSSADGVITLTSGDNFLASKEFNASLDNGVPYYDSIALSGLYDAMALGNHDFDFGPEVTAAFISGFDPAIPFLSANADFSGEPLLAALEASGQIAGSTVIDVAGTQVGVIGAVTPLLASISSPRNVVISADVAAAVNGEVAALEAAGVNKIILISHLQGVDEDRALIPLLSGVDVAIAGGGDELFANPGDTCNIGTVADTYPGAVVDADGNTVPLVTGPGGYRCIGQLDVTFTADGDLVTATGSANLVPLDATPDPGVLADVETPIAAAVAALEANVLGVSEVDLDGVRASVRTTSSNEGSLLADALLDAAQRLAPDFGATPPVIALQNGGGIRNDSVIPAGNITEGDTFDIAPFANFVVAVEVPRETLKDLLEVAYGGLPAASGRFAQPAGFTVRINPDAPAREIDSTCAVTGNTGERVLNMTLNDGTVIIQNGTVIPGPDISVATIDFLARGGDCYPLGNLTFTALGTSYQQALADYITGTLNNTITATQYPETGTNRVVSVDNSNPPVLSLPDDITVSATSAQGAVVTYDATATDDIDGDVPVTCVPASGDTFAIGLTMVDCSATDSSMNTANGSFNVIVIDLPDLTIREQLQAVADALRDVDDLSRREARLVRRAVRYLNRADSDRYWDDGNTLDSRRGHTALANMTWAVAQLDRVHNATVNDLAITVVEQMRSLAQANIDHAIDVGGNPYLIEWAMQSLDRGDYRLDRGHLTYAAYYYKSAWYRARLAIIFRGHH